MFSKIKMIGILVTFSLVGCQQNTLIQKDEVLPVSASKPFEMAKKDSVSKIALTNPTPSKATKDPNVIVVNTCPVAAIHGHLKIKEQCLIIETGGTTAIQPIFSKNAVEWNESTKTLTYLGKDYKEGDEIHFGGGGLPNEDEFRKLPNVSIPNCPNTTLFAVCP